MNPRIAKKRRARRRFWAAWVRSKYRFYDAMHLKGKYAKAARRSKVPFISEARDDYAIGAPYNGFAPLPPGPSPLAQNVLFAGGRWRLSRFGIFNCEVHLVGSTALDIGEGYFWHCNLVMLKETFYV